MLLTSGGRHILWQKLQSACFIYDWLFFLLTVFLVLSRTRESHHFRPDRGELGRVSSNDLPRHPVKVSVCIMLSNDSVSSSTSRMKTALKATRNSQCKDLFWLELKNNLHLRSHVQRWSCFFFFFLFWDQSSWGLSGQIELITFQISCF